MKALRQGYAHATDTVSFLGLTLQPRSLLEMNDLVDQGIRERRKWIIANHNLHSVYLLHKFAKLREFYARVHWTYVDGMPLVALAKLYGYPVQREQRVTLADWFAPLMKLAAGKGWRVFYIGSAKTIVEQGAAKLRRLCPELALEVHDGYFDATRGSAENEALVERINAFRPDLLMVGMGMPRQELWTQENFARLDAHVILSSNGAAMDYFADAIPTPPRWSGRIGMEWLFRLGNEPRRLFARYFVEPWYVLLLLLLDYPRSRHTVRLRTRTQLGS